ncbi:RNA-directed DNA polymerase from transposon X-element [Labeo rohita]|uniref:RNA-directed DNA polymerase from transposon X-element n=1 Tax=Labeo rohita TaxID=84645 RepID=A0A498P2R0_LABRO|nr:RNA-directed DNA polymerase from transposon X-element [Labeo rohita]
MGKSQSKFGKYDTPTFAQMRKSAGEKCMLDIEKLIKYHEFPREGTLSVAKLKAVKESVKEGSEVLKKCCARHVCKECEATVNCWLREAERRERKALQKAMAGSKIKPEGKQTEIEKNREKINEMLKEMSVSEEKIREIKEGKALALITCTNLSDVSVSEHVPPPYHHYPMAELQALRVDPDLDCSPPRKPTAPPAAAAAQWVTQPTEWEERLPATRPKSLILQRKRASENRLSEEQEDYADVPETPLFDNKDEEEELMMRRTPQMKRKRPLTRLTVKREERNITAPMIEVSGPDGPMMVFRPWTALEAREAMAHLPDVSEGGDRLSTELLRFCEEFSPTMTELRRLLLSKLGPSNWLSNPKCCKRWSSVPDCGGLRGKRPPGETDDEPLRKRVRLAAFHLPVPSHVVGNSGKFVRYKQSPILGRRSAGRKPMRSLSLSTSVSPAHAGGPVGAEGFNDAPQVVSGSPSSDDEPSRMNHGALQPLSHYLDAWRALPDSPASSGHQMGQGDDMLGPLGSPALEEPSLGNAAVSDSPVANTSEEGPALTGERHDLASPACGAFMFGASMGAFAALCESE